MRSIKQLRRGLKETHMWTLLTQRPDTVPLLFPQELAAVNPEVNFVFLNTVFINNILLCVVENVVQSKL